MIGMDWARGAVEVVSERDRHGNPLRTVLYKQNRRGACGGTGDMASLVRVIRDYGK